MHIKYYDGNPLDNVGFSILDLDWDTTNDEPIDDQSANAILDSYRKFYTAPDYISYASRQSGGEQPNQTVLEQLYQRAEQMSQRFGVDIRIPGQFIQSGFLVSPVNLKMGANCPG